MTFADKTWFISGTNKLSSIVCVVQCSEDLYIVAMKQPFNKCMAQHRRAMPTGAVHLHLKDKEHSPEDAVFTFWTNKTDGVFTSPPNCLC